MKEFAILPWEHVGASFAPQAHAQTRLEIGYKKRTFLLKMREGIIYFKEPTLANIYAIPKIFTPTLADDPKELIEAWTREVREENYGLLLVSHRKWPKTPTQANFCIILRPNYSGWVAEHFDSTWKEFSLPKSLSFFVWGSKGAYFDLTDAIFKATGAQFLNRSVDPALFKIIPTGWTHGTQQEFLDVVRAAFLLFASPFPPNWAGGAMSCTCKSNSPFLEGSVSSSLIYAGQEFSGFRKVWTIIKNHCGFVGLEWRKATDHPELQAQFDPKIWERGIEQWGENWRGNWIGSGTNMEITFPPVSAPSHHDRLEAALTLRWFLRDKMPPEKLENLLQQALSN